MSKKKARKNWTSSEEEVLLENVRENVNNLNYAFELTAKTLKRSSSSVSGHWYSRTSRDNKHILFLTVSGKHVSFNRKNSRGNNIESSLFSKILKIFGF